jgi:nitrous oxidase accessory protein
MTLRQKHIHFILACAAACLFSSSQLFAVSLQPVIDAAKPGDTIRINSGVYEGDIVVNKPLILLGLKYPVLKGSGKGSVVTITADDCTIQGFVIERSGRGLRNEDSGILLKSQRNHIEGNRLSDVLFGIYLFHSTNNSIVNNRIRGRKEIDLGDRGSGIHLWDSPSNRIEGNIVSDARDGLFIQNSKDNIIVRNRISDLRYGVHYMFSDTNRFEENVFTNNVAGAAIMYSKDITFQRNLFLHNRGYSSFGILFQDCTRCNAEENWIVDNVTGLFAEALRESIIRRNVIAENDVAIEMFGSAQGNTVAENNFVDNLSPLQLVGNRTGTRWHQQGRGNFWSEYDGYDLNEDGIGDVKKKVQNVFEYMEGNHPRLRLFLYSPAAAAIGMAEKAFPLLEGTDEIDPAPLMRAVSMQLPEEVMRKTSRFSLPLICFSFAISTLAGYFFWSAQR